MAWSVVLAKEDQSGDRQTKEKLTSFGTRCISIHVSTAWPDGDSNCLKVMLLYCSVASPHRFLIQGDGSR